MGWLVTTVLIVIAGAVVASIRHQRLEHELERKIREAAGAELTRIKELFPGGLFASVAHDAFFEFFARAVSKAQRRYRRRSIFGSGLAFVWFLTAVILITNGYENDLTMQFIIAGALLFCGISFILGGYYLVRFLLFNARIPGGSYHPFDLFLED